MSPDAKRPALDELKRLLGENAEALGRSLYGEPTTKRGRHEYRWGRCGSVQLIRRKGGWRWRDYETGESGSLLDGICHALGLDFTGAVQ